MVFNKIHIKNFKALRDTGELDVKPLTFLVGPNSSGKTSLIQAILALRQTVQSPDQRTPLILNDYVDLGSYKDVVFKHNEKNDIHINLEIPDVRCDIVFSVYTSGKNHGIIYLNSLDFSGKDVLMPQKEKKKFVTEDVNFSVRKRARGGRYFITIKDKDSKDEQPVELRKFYMISPEKEYKDPSKFEEYLWKHPNLWFAIAVLGTIIENIFDDVYHIGPLRNEPERTYLAAGASPSDVGKRGEETVDILLLERKLKEKVKLWLKNFDISLEFDLEELKGKSGGATSVYNIMLKDPNTKTKVNLIDVGFGASQILPIIVQGFNTPKNSLILIEQPEIHLHPKAQATMGDLLVDIAKSNERKLIIETHCDLLIRRVCKNILQKKIKHTDVVIYYFEPTDNGTEIKTITINENGQFENFPEGFFEEGFEEAMEIAELMVPEE
ncbi:MAG: AAA ATPase domain protein [Candidatus Argoarchaeum ethanivorans]|uniref:AAA ATPase domain protein n=1 Tax=Candidatus Argoarchaeum ethanivorans TaxID=2608793 RepID=A0A811T7W2_9EURY|nr:MAG: AAA ATPase domain protein [Candidatus Argoarchaeum ethanivorans]